MNSDFLHTAKLKTVSIQQVNDALIVLKHFVELNHKLLPMLYSLCEETMPSDKDLQAIQKIKNVFDAYQFDVNASLILMNSPVLDLIQKSYHSITEKSLSSKSATDLEKFKLEFKKLKANWNEIHSN